VEDNLYTCSQDTQAKIKDASKKQSEPGHRRVLFSENHEPMFRETVRRPD